MNQIVAEGTALDDRSARSRTANTTSPRRTLPFGCERMVFIERAGPVIDDFASGTETHPIKGVHLPSLSTMPSGSATAAVSSADVVACQRWVIVVRTQTSFWTSVAWRVPA